MCNNSLFWGTPGRTSKFSEPSQLSYQLLLLSLSYSNEEKLFRVLFYMNTNMYGDFQICISVPLTLTNFITVQKSKTIAMPYPVNQFA